MLRSLTPVTQAMMLSTLLFSTVAVHAQTQEPADAHEDGHVFDTSDPFGSVWINDVGTWLDVDRDRDGWFSRFAVSIDADVADDDDGYGYGYSDNEARVFARLSLTDSRGIERLLYESARFDLYGRNSSDRYRIELDLREAFDQDFYDIVVELYDARSEQLMDVVDARDFRTLENLPLEDAIRDGRVADDGYSDSYVAVEYAGASGPLGLLLATSLTIWRRRGARRQVTR